MPGRDGPENLRILKKSRLRFEIGPWSRVVGDSAIESKSWVFSDLYRQRWLEVLNTTRCAERKTFKNCVSLLVSKNRSQKLINRSYLNNSVHLFPPLYYICVLYYSCDRYHWNKPMIRICGIDIGNLKTGNSRNWFRYETFYYLWVKGNSTWGEWYTIFLGWLFHLPPTTTTRDTPLQTTGLISASPESQPSSSDAKTQLPDFSQIPQILRARFGCMTSLTSPGLISYLGFLFWYLWMTHPPRARMNTCAHVAPN